MVDCHVGMHRDACDAYLAEGRIAELRTLAPGGRVVGKSTMGVGALEVRASRFCCRRLRRVRARARASALALWAHAVAAAGLSAGDGMRPGREWPRPRSRMATPF